MNNARQNEGGLAFRRHRCGATFTEQLDSPIGRLHFQGDQLVGKVLKRSATFAPAKASSIEFESNRNPFKVNLESSSLFDSLPDCLNG